MKRTRRQRPPPCDAGRLFTMSWKLKATLLAIVVFGAVLAITDGDAAGSALAAFVSVAAILALWARDKGKE